MGRNISNLIGLDVLPCEHRYSREARIHGIPLRSSFSTCGDFENMFPKALKLTKDTRQKVIPTEDRKSTKIWYSWKSEGFLPTTRPIKFALDFTIRYNTQEEAESGTAPPKANSEFSFRVFKHAPRYYSASAPTEEDLFQTYMWYKRMLDEFGSFEEFPCEGEEKKELRVPL
mgnify:CR=1 FL=1